MRKSFPKCLISTPSCEPPPTEIEFIRRDTEFDFQTSNEALRIQHAIPILLQRYPLEGSGGKFVAGRSVDGRNSILRPVLTV